MELVRYYASDLYKIITDLGHTPLGFPILMAYLWRAHNKTLSVGLVLQSLIIPYILQAFGLSRLPEFLDQELLLRSMKNNGEFDELIKTLNINVSLIHPRISEFGYIMFCVVMVKPDERWVSGTIKLALMFLFLTSASMLLMVGFLNIVETTGYLDPPSTPPSNLEEAKIFILSRLNWFAGVPHFSAAVAMLMYIFGSQSMLYLKNDDRRGIGVLVVTHMICPLMIMSLSITALYILQTWKTVLFIIFMTMSYPLLLAVTRQPAADKDIIQLWTSGVTEFYRMVAFRVSRRDS
jgi:hypothetical protein